MLAHSLYAFGKTAGQLCTMGSSSLAHTKVLLRLPVFLFILSVCSHIHMLTDVNQHEVSLPALACSTDSRLHSALAIASCLLVPLAMPYASSCACSSINLIKAMDRSVTGGKCETICSANARKLARLAEVQVCAAEPTYVTRPNKQPIRSRQSGRRQ